MPQRTVLTTSIIRAVTQSAGTSAAFDDMSASMSRRFEPRITHLKLLTWNVKHARLRRYEQEAGQGPCCDYDGMFRCRAVQSAASSICTAVEWASACKLPPGCPTAEPGASCKQPEVPLKISLSMADECVGGEKC